jgi:protein-S-isoprenylcysteine O-methyltransferase Ste14
MKKRITPDGWFIILLILSILLHARIPLVRLISFPWNLSGIVLIITGILMTIGVNYSLLKNKTSVQPFETPDRLITTGLFRYSRNPLYLGMVIALIGVVITLRSLSSLVSPIIFVLIINFLIIPVEENNLEEAFGDKYLVYKKETRRWI